MAYDFKIGTTLAGMVTLTSLGVSAPKCEYGKYSGELTLGDGTSRGVGLPMTVWHWDFLSSVQRTALRTYCAGKSASVFIRTLKDDNTYANYAAVLVWQTREERAAGRVVDLNLEFRNMVEQ